MSDPDQHLTEEPQSARGDPGSRDTGENRASGGPAERPEGAVADAEEVPSHGGSDEQATGEMPPQDTKPAVPPYEGRQTAGLGTAPGDSGGARTGGATGPQTDSGYKSAAPGSTPRGATGSPADEQPASQAPETDRDPDMTGPSHTPGTRRAER